MPWTFTEWLDHQPFSDDVRKPENSACLRLMKYAWDGGINAGREGSPEGGVSFNLNREDRDLIKSALRQLANHYRKLMRQHPGAIRNWTDEKEAANPGFRDFLMNEVPRRHEAQITRIDNVRVKLRLSPFETFDDNRIESSEEEAM